MHFQKMNAPKRVLNGLWNAAWLTAVLLAMLSMLDWLAYFPWILPGALAVFAVNFLSTRHQKIAAGALCVLCILWCAMRFAAVADGFRILANRFSAQSEAAQSYEYTYFAAKGTLPTEILAFLSIFLGALCVLGGNWMNLGLTICIGIAVAYFGIAPKPLWLALLLIAAASNALPKQGRWVPALILAVLIVMMTFGMQALAPQPNAAISAADEALRDRLAENTLFYDQQPIPVEVPEPELVPPPPEQAQQPNHGVQKKTTRFLFVLLSALTVLLLFLPAILRDRAEKKRTKNRAAMHDVDNGAAIRAMYLYARKWRALEKAPEPVAPEIEALWLEAAYSTHQMTEEQREIMCRFVSESAERIWSKADRSMRFAIRYRYAL